MEWVLSIIGTMLGSSAISVFITNWFGRRKIRAEAEGVAVDGALKWAESMRKDIDDLRCDLRETRNDYKELQKENNLLRLEIAQLRADLTIAQAELQMYKVKHGEINANAAS